jgi:hypothetical protein
MKKPENGFILNEEDFFRVVREVFKTPSRQPSIVPGLFFCKFESSRKGVSIKFVESLIQAI